MEIEMKEEEHKSILINLTYYVLFVNLKATNSAYRNFGHDDKISARIY